MHHCTRCGTPVDEGDGVVNEEEGYAYCGPCEANHQEWLAREYPHGQCQTCGAEGYLVVRYGREEVRFNHAEGQCPHWVDWVDVDAAEDEEMAERGPAQPTGAQCFDPVAYEDAEQLYLSRLLAAAQDPQDPGEPF